MKTVRKTYFFLLAPFILVTAIVVFVLDNFNIDVNPIVSYTTKEVAK